MSKSQLEEYLEYREILRERVEEYRRIAKDQTAEPAKRRAANLKWQLYWSWIEDVDIQIRAIDPTAVPKRKERGSRVVLSLNKRGETGREAIEFLRAPEQDERDDNSQQDKKRCAIITEAAEHLTPRQAEALDLRYNEGMTLSKVAEKMGISFRAADQKVKQAENILSHWATIREAVERCTADERTFFFDEFYEAAPFAFSRKCTDIIMALYDAPLSRYRTIRSLATALERNERVVSRDLGKVKELCLTYGIPLAACHPLIRNSRQKGFDGAMVFHYYRIFEQQRVCRYFHKDAERNFRMRSPAIQHQTVESAVRARLRGEYGTEDADDYIDEALRLFDEDRLHTARERIDCGKTLSECETRYDVGKVREKTLAVIETAALYAYFKSDVHRIFTEGGEWQELFARWDCFPPAVGAALRYLLENRNTETVALLAEEMGVSHASAGSTVRMIGFYSRWWGVPDDRLPDLARKYLGATARTKRGIYPFRRVVALRHDTRTGDMADVGSQEIERDSGILPCRAR